MENTILPLKDILCVLPLIIIFLASIMPISLKVLRGNKEPNPTAVVGYGLVGLFGALVTSISLFSNNPDGFYAYSKTVLFDGMALFATVMICIITGIALVMSREHLNTRGAQFSEYVFLLLNSAIGMMVLAWSNDLIITFIGIEVMSLCLYLIIALSKEESLSKEAAFKYFVLGSFASAIFLYGVAFLFGLSGTTQIDRLLMIAPSLISKSQLFLIGVSLLIIGFGFKVSLAPFHAWTPDVYEGAPTPVTAFMSTAVKLASFVAFIRLVIGNYVTADLTGNLLGVLQWLAVLTMLVGNIGAIMQPSLKRMLAYSSVSHSGFIFMSLVAASVGGEAWLGISGMNFYLFTYAIMTLGAFAVVAVLEKKNNDLVLIDDLAGLHKKDPTLAFCLSVFMLSLAGLPPTLGFFGKFFVFSAVIKQGFFWLAIWGAINSVIAVYYYLRPIVVIYMHEPKEVITVDNKGGTYFTVTTMAAMVILFGLATDSIYTLITATVSSLF